MKKLLEDLRDWPKAVKDAVRNSDDIKYLKICDQKVLEPEQWYSAKGRCVLLGDAAHPLTPHSGQGANQSLWVYPSCLALPCFSNIQELNSNRADAWHLAQILPSFESTIPPATPLSVNHMKCSELKAFFEAFARKRQPRTAAIMKIPRGVGDLK